MTKNGIVTSDDTIIVKRGEKDFRVKVYLRAEDNSLFAGAVTDTRVLADILEEVRQRVLSGNSTEPTA